MGTWADIDTTVDQLGPAMIPSSARGRRVFGPGDRVVMPLRVDDFPSGAPPSLELAGPRERLYFQPASVRCVVAVCGGVCPGLNDAIRALVLALHQGYGVRTVLGARFGLRGLTPEFEHELVELTPAGVADSHRVGGVLLGTSRAPQHPPQVAAVLDRLGIDILFLIGGRGAMRAGAELHRLLAERGRAVAVVGIPRRIDNDLLLVERSFGFATAVDEAVRVIRSVLAEAVAAPGGIGLVQVPGRRSGIFAATATLACPGVGFCLVPEFDFELDGEAGLFRALRERLRGRGHAVLVAAEGAGGRYAGLAGGDIGRFLQEKIQEYCDGMGLPVSLRYTDAGDRCRGVRADSGDHLLAGFAARNAAHAGLAGKAGVAIGLVHHHFVHVPLTEVNRLRSLAADPALWQAVLEATGQPAPRGQERAQ